MSADAQAVVLLLQAHPEAAPEIAVVVDQMLGRKPPEELITVSEFALVIRRHEETVRRYARDDRIMGARREADRWLIPRGASVLPPASNAALGITQARRRPVRRTSAAEALRERALAA